MGSGTKRFGDPWLMGYRKSPAVPESPHCIWLHPNPYLVPQSSWCSLHRTARPSNRAGATIFCVISQVRNTFLSDSFPDTIKLNNQMSCLCSNPLPQIKSRPPSFVPTSLLKPLHPPTSNLSLSKDAEKNISPYPEINLVRPSYFRRWHLHFYTFLKKENHKE